LHSALGSPAGSLSGSYSFDGIVEESGSSVGV
jgi:hypothetical protein